MKCDNDKCSYKYNIACHAYIYSLACVLQYNIYDVIIPLKVSHTRKQQKQLVANEESFEKPGRYSNRPGCFEYIVLL